MDGKKVLTMALVAVGVIAVMGQFEWSKNLLSDVSGGNRFFN